MEERLEMLKTVASARYWFHLLEFERMADAALTYNKPLILIVDDDRFMRVTCQDTLEQAGFRTATAPDGTAAISCFKSLHPDLVILDLMMPGKDGFRTCRELRGLPGASYTPVLVITSLEDTEAIHLAFEAGATDFVVKPVIPDLLIYRVRYMLRASRSMKNLAASEARLGHAQRLASLGNWEWYPDTGTFWGSEETFRLLGMAKYPDIFSWDSFLLTIHPPDRERVVTALESVRHDKIACALECRICQADMELRAVRLLAHGEATLPGRIPRVVGTLQDITEMKRYEERLTMLKEAIDCLPIGITLSDVNGRIIYTNPAEAVMHGYSLEELVGTEAGQLAPRNRRSLFSPEKLANLGLWRRESTNIRKNGHEFPVQLTSLAVKNAEGQCLGLVTSCEDITSKKEAEERIQYLAFFDPLTGLPNRAAFLDRLQQALALAHREGRQIGLLFLDLDNFKDVNDTQGHDFGDKLLRGVAGRLADSMRESDTLARLGGDEFVVVLSTVSSQESVAIAAQRILTTLSQPFVLDGRQIYSSASIGIALYPDDGQDSDSLFKSADTAMYHAKTEGKANYRFFSQAMNQTIMRRVALENSMRLALEKEEFFLHYQPQWDLRTARITGVEVLLRWHSGEFGLLPPAEFISLAENSGLIFGLGEWVMRTACNQARSWALAGHRGLSVAINISGVQFRQPGFLDSIGTIIRETGVDPGTIELEFTESIIMENAVKTTDTLQALKKMGVRLSIDDFGTGYSSLSYLKHFPIDRIKIDQSFIADVHRNNDDAAIVTAIISIARSLNLKVIAEGVENSEQLHFLAARNCDEAQGFYLAAPMTAKDLDESLLGAQRQEAITHPAVTRYHDLQLSADCPEILVEPEGDVINENGLV
jgi:diguanylate cyclase (GGDEF)-like protein/PAS domain S-box-containing protein